MENSVPFPVTSPGEFVWRPEDVVEVLTLDDSQEHLAIVLEQGLMEGIVPPAVRFCIVNGHRASIKSICGGCWPPTIV